MVLCLVGISSLRCGLVFSFSFSCFVLEITRGFSYISGQRMSDVYCTQELCEWLPGFSAWRDCGREQTSLLTNIFH